MKNIFTILIASTGLFLVSCQKDPEYNSTTVAYLDPHLLGTNSETGMVFQVTGSILSAKPIEIEYVEILKSRYDSTFSNIDNSPEIVSLPIFPNESTDFVPTYDHPNVDPAPLFTSANTEHFDTYEIPMLYEVGGKSGSAIRIETTKMPDSKVLTSYAVWGDGTNNWNLKNGIPLNGQEVLKGITVDTRYSLNVDSPGLVLLYPTKNGNAAGNGNNNNNLPGVYVYQINGERSNFKSDTFRFQPALTAAPDSIVIGFSSNNLLGSSNLEGNFMEIDNVSFLNSNQIVPGGNLDVWEQVIKADPYVEGTPYIFKQNEELYPGDKCFMMFRYRLTNSDSLYTSNIIKMENDNGFQGQ